MKNLHLGISVVTIVPVALVYGWNPVLVLPLIFDFNIENTALANIFRSTMGLYGGTCILWILGIIQPKWWVTATVANIVFFGGLASGRLISFILDGYPGIYILTGFIVESLFAFWGWKNLRSYKP